MLLAFPAPAAAGEGCVVIARSDRASKPSLWHAP
jgi:hypothetical protein